MKTANARRRRLRRLARRIFQQCLLVVTTPVAWWRSLSNATVLLRDHNDNYMGFRPKNALNSLFYRTQWLNIDRFGFSGRSTLVSFGDFPLSRWLHISRLSHAAFARAGAATMLLGTVGWSVAHLAWLIESPAAWTLLVTLTLLVSTTAYAMAFVLQNYNIRIFYIL